VPQYFKSSSDYFQRVAELTSDPLGWTGLRIYSAVETSNDVVFEKTHRHSITLELTGTRTHLSQFDGISSDRPTQSGEVCQIPAGLSARFAWDTIDDTQRSIMLDFDNQLFQTFCPEILGESFADGHLLPRDYDASPAISSLITILSRELSSANARGSLFAQCALRLFAMELAYSQWSRMPRAFSHGTRTDPRILRAIEFANANYKRDISLNQLCEASGLSATRLIFLFRKTVGKTPYAYIVRKRIDHAILLLENSNLPISHIAFDSGFSDQQHMTHVFKIHVGRTPASIRSAR
jgi:AraC family transcriptional regulator